MLSVPTAAVTKGPSVQWRHIDGPLMHWAGHSHWLTIREALAIIFRLSSIDRVAAIHWPHLAELRVKLAV